jgi:hypothetical protein
MSFEPYSLLASLFFSIVGIGALGYGRKLGLWQPSAIGVAMMGFPYFVSAAWLIWLIGSGLCVLLWFYHYE